MKLTLARVAEFLPAVGEFDGRARAEGYSIDSRTIRAGELFFAVKGERLDGHDFVEQALGRGAVGAVIAREHETRYPRRAGLLIVEDTLAALQALAAAVRERFGRPVFEAEQKRLFERIRG